MTTSTHPSNPVVRPAGHGPSIEEVRARFPALASDDLFLENAGGSQVPLVVADAVREHMLERYVQLGAGYARSDRATAVVNDAHAWMETFCGAADRGRVILESSCTALTHMLARCHESILRPGDEIVLATTAHEANAGPWMRFADRGVTIRWWDVDPATGESTLDGLRDVLTDRTRLVAFPHVSNLLGAIIDVEGATRLAHEVGAKVVVDGVAFAPHRAMRVAEWNVDWYVWSTYKVFGPHMGALYGTNEAIAELEGPNHFFIPNTEVPYKFELGGVSHEGCAGLLALRGYMAFLAGEEGIDEAAVTHETVMRAFDRATVFETDVQERILEWLASVPGVRVVGPTDTGADARVPTISFLSDRAKPSAISAAAHAANIGIRNGHMYAWRLCERMGIPHDEGVVRVSAAHYNVPSEVDRLATALAPVLRGEASR